MRLPIIVMFVSLLSISLFSVLMYNYPSDHSVFGDLPPGSNPIKISITSSSSIHAIAGQIITVNGTITNSGLNQIGGIAYISIIDVPNEAPIDLEDWSAHKGIGISLAPGQSISMEWNVRLVKDGSFTIVILFSSNDGSVPTTASAKTFLEVAPKNNLNPGNVLPVVFGVPAFLMVILGAISYTRGRKMGVYQ